MSQEDKPTKEKVKRLRNKLKEGRYSPAKHSRKNVKRSWCEAAMGDLLDEMDIDYDIEKSLKFKNGWKHYDINLIDYPILIEVDGDYWHRNKETKGATKPNFIQMKNKQNDYIKNFVAKNAGYKLIRVWESDLKDNYDGVKERITEILTEIKSEAE